MMKNEDLSAGASLDTSTPAEEYGVKPEYLDNQG